MAISALQKLSTLSLSLLLMGCLEADGGDLLEDYQQRLANVLDVSTQEPHASVYLSVPDKRDLAIEIPRVSLGLLESYGLRECGLFNLIAEKNSILGKVQNHFANWDYQTALLTTIDQCLTSGKLTEKERVTLEGIQQTKLQHLRWHWHNLVTLSDATRKQITHQRWLSQPDFTHIGDVANQLDTLLSQTRFFDTKASKIDNPIAPISQASISQTPITQATVTQTTIIRLQEANIQETNVQQTNVQETIEKKPVIGSLLFSMSNSTEWLNSTNRLLKQHQDKVVCRKNRDTTRFKYLNNVFNLYYVDSVQPYLAQLDRSYIKLEPALLTYQTHFSTESVNFDIKEIKQAFRNATLEHVSIWKSLFERCGRKVTR